MLNPSNKDMGDLLLEEKLINHEQLEKAVEQQKKSMKNLEQILIGLGYVTEKDICKTLGKKIGVPFIDLDEEKIEEEVARSIPEHLAIRYKVIPVSIKKGVWSKITGKTLKELPDEININSLRTLINEKFSRTELRDKLTELNYQEKEIETILNHVQEVTEEKLSLAMAVPMNVIARDDIRLITGFDTEPVIATEKSIAKAINKYFGVTDDERVYHIDHFASEDVEHKEENIELRRLIKLANDPPIIRAVNLIITQAIKDKASAVYIEPGSEGMVVFYKIDEILHNVIGTVKDIQEAVITRIKLMADLDILEKSLPQKGKIYIIMDSKEYAFRVLTSPISHGEKISMSILDKERITDPDKLGLKGERKKNFQELFSKESGMIMVTGPPESGKSTTLYTALNMLNGPDKNICTIEQKRAFS